MTAVLEVEGLTVRHGPGCPTCEAGLDRSTCPACGTVWACRDVGFDLEAGEVLGIVGESGSGKSTTLACVHLDQRPARGAVRLLGEDVTAATGTARRRLRSEAMGMVYQSAREGPGGSHHGNGSAREALAAGSLTVLASDYHPPSLLSAAYALAGQGACSWPEAMALVTAGPARAAGLSDRGRIAADARADLVAVGLRSGLPTVAGTWVAGRRVR